MRQVNPFALRKSTISVTYQVKVYDYQSIRVSQFLKCPHCAKFSINHLCTCYMLKLDYLNKKLFFFFVEFDWVKVDRLKEFRV